MATKPLKRINELWHYINGKKIPGPCAGLVGHCTGLVGNCTRMSGDCSGLSGDCTGLVGNCSGLFGNCSLIPVDARPSLLENWVAD